jgi:hypothetical protein
VQFKGSKDPFCGRDLNPSWAILQSQRVNTLGVTVVIDTYRFDPLRASRRHGKPSSKSGENRKWPRRQRRTANTDRLLGPSIADPRAHAKCSQPEAHGTNRSIEALRDLIHRLVSRPIQWPAIFFSSPGTGGRTRTGDGALRCVRSALRSAYLKSRRLRISPQLSDTPPTVAALPFRD